MQIGCPFFGAGKSWDVCVCVCVYTLYICICIFMCVYIHTNILFWCRNKLGYVCVCVYICTLHIYVYMYMYMYVCVYIHTYLIGAGTSWCSRAFVALIWKRSGDWV